MNASEPIRRLARVSADGVAYANVQGQHVTFAQLDAMIDAVAHRIRAAGLAPGHTVSLWTPDLYRHLVTAMALARVGVAWGPPQLPPGVLQAALHDEGADALPGVPTVPLATLAPTAPGTVAPFPMHAGGDATMAWYGSSGTTASRRFTRVSHALALRRADGRALRFAAMPGARGTSGVRVASLLGPSGSYGYSSLLIALYGGNTVLEAPADPAALPAWIARSGVTYLVASPAMLQQVAAALPGGGVPAPRLTIEVGGSSLPAPLAAQIRARLATTIVVNYGATETGRVAWAQVPAEPAAMALAPYPAVTMQIVDEDDRLLPAGAEGVVRVAGPQVASAYLTPGGAVFRAGYVYPGDRGRVDAAGALQLLGRVDDRLNVGGVKIDPEVVEAQLAALGDVRETAFFAFTDDQGRERLCVAVVPGPAFVPSDFEARLRQTLAALAPQFVMQVRALPRNENGKLVRQRLAEAARRLAAAPGVPEAGA